MEADNNGLALLPPHLSTPAEIEKAEAAAAVAPTYAAFASAWSEVLLPVTSPGFDRWTRITFVNPSLITATAIAKRAPGVLGWTLAAGMPTAVTDNEGWATYVRSLHAFLERSPGAIAKGDDGSPLRVQDLGHDVSTRAYALPLDDIAVATYDVAGLAPPLGPVVSGPTARAALISRNLWEEDQKLAVEALASPLWLTLIRDFGTEPPAAADDRLAWATQLSLAFDEAQQAALQLVASAAPWEPVPFNTAVDRSLYPDLAALVDATLDNVSRPLALHSVALTSAALRPRGLDDAAAAARVLATQGVMVAACAYVDSAVRAARELHGVIKPLLKQVDDVTAETEDRLEHIATLRARRPHLPDDYTGYDYNDLAAARLGIHVENRTDASAGASAGAGAGAVSSVRSQAAVAEQQVTEAQHRARLRKVYARTAVKDRRLLAKSRASSSQSSYAAGTGTGTAAPFSLDDLTASLARVRVRTPLTPDAAKLAAIRAEVRRTQKLQQLADQRRKLEAGIHRRRAALADVEFWSRAVTEARREVDNLKALNARVGVSRGLQQDVSEPMRRLVAAQAKLAAANAVLSEQDSPTPPPTRTSRDEFE